jgi:hypothetical protein
MAHVNSLCEVKGFLMSASFCPRGFRILSAALVAGALAGCATSVVPGMTRDEVTARMGKPPRVVALPSGERWQYSRQPAGQSAVMVDLDASGRVVSAREVLTENEFNRIQIDRWTRADVEREFGRPALISGVANWPHDIMTYRWRSPTADMFYWVFLDQNQVVRRTQQGMDFPYETQE